MGNRRQSLSVYGVPAALVVDEQTSLSLSLAGEGVGATHNMQEETALFVLKYLSKVHTSSRVHLRFNTRYCEHTTRYCLLSHLITPGIPAGTALVEGRYACYLIRLLMMTTSLPKLVTEHLPIRHFW